MRLTGRQPGPATWGRDDSDDALRAQPSRRQPERVPCSATESQERARSSFPALFTTSTYPRPPIAAPSDARQRSVFRRGLRQSCSPGPMPQEVVLEKSKSDESLGLLVIASKDELVIKSVKDGPLLNWNIRNPGIAVKDGDHIVGVNSITGSAAEMMQMMKHTRKLKLDIRRKEASGTLELPPGSSEKTPNSTPGPEAAGQRALENIRMMAQRRSTSETPSAMADAPSECAPSSQAAGVGAGDQRAPSSMAERCSISRLGRRDQEDDHERAAGLRLQSKKEDVGAKPADSASSAPRPPSIIPSSGRDSSIFRRTLRNRSKRDQPQQDGTRAATLDVHIPGPATEEDHAHRPTRRHSIGLPYPSRKGSQDLTEKRPARAEGERETWRRSFVLPHGSRRGASKERTPDDGEQPPPSQAPEDPVTKRPSFGLRRSQSRGSGEEPLPQGQGVASSSAASCAKRRPCFGEAVRRHDGRPFKSASGWAMGLDSTASVVEVAYDGTFKLRNAEGQVSRWMSRVGFISDQPSCSSRAPSACTRRASPVLSKDRSEDIAAELDAIVPDCGGVGPSRRPSLVNRVLSRFSKEPGEDDRSNPPESREERSEKRPLVDISGSVLNSKSSAEAFWKDEFKHAAADATLDIKTPVPPKAPAAPSNFKRVFRRASAASKDKANAEAPVALHQEEKAPSEVPSASGEEAEVPTVAATSACREKQAISLDERLEDADRTSSLSVSVTDLKCALEKKPALAPGVKSLEDAISFYERLEAERREAERMNTERLEAKYLEAEAENRLAEHLEAAWEADRLEAKHVEAEMMQAVRPKAGRRDNEAEVAEVTILMGEEMEEQDQEFRALPSNGEEEPLDEVITISSERGQDQADDVMALSREIVSTASAMMSHDESISVEESTFGSTFDEESLLAECLRQSLKTPTIPAQCRAAGESWHSAAEAVTHRALSHAVAGLTYAGVSRRISAQSATARDGTCEAAADGRESRSGQRKASASRVKLKKVLLRFDPPGIGLQHTDGQGGLAVRHKTLPSKEEISSDEDIHRLVDSLLDSDGDLLSSKRHRVILQEQLRHLYWFSGQALQSGTMPSEPEPVPESNGVATPPRARVGFRHGSEDIDMDKEQEGDKATESTASSSAALSSRPGSARRVRIGLGEVVIASQCAEVTSYGTSGLPAGYHSPHQTQRCHYSCSEEAAEPFALRPSVVNMMMPAYATA